MKVVGHKDLSGWFFIVLKPYSCNNALINEKCMPYHSKIKIFKKNINHFEMKKTS